MICQNFTLHNFIVADNHVRCMHSNCIVIPWVCGPVLIIIIMYQ